MPFGSPCATGRVDELQQDQGGGLRPHANPAAVAAAAVRSDLHARVAAVPAAAEHAGGRSDGLHDELDRAAVAAVGARGGARAAGSALGAQTPAERERPVRAEEHRPTRAARVAGRARGAGGVDGSADDQCALRAESVTLPPGALRFSPRAAIEPVVTRSPVIGTLPPGSTGAERAAAAAVRGDGSDAGGAGGLDRHRAAGLAAAVHGSEVASPASAVIEPRATEAPVTLTAPPCLPPCGLPAPEALMAPALRAAPGVSETGPPAPGAEVRARRRPSS